MNFNPNIIANLMIEERKSLMYLAQRKRSRYTRTLSHGNSRQINQRFDLEQQVRRPSYLFL
jgi:hypothetical protein